MGRSLDPQSPEEQEEEKRGFANNGFNQFRSDRIALDREIPDTRDPRCVCVCMCVCVLCGWLTSCMCVCRCVDRHYRGRLPIASVVIIFHNEAYTVLLRTITSIINRSPPHLLHEIILVDDFSDHGNQFTGTRELLVMCMHSLLVLNQDRFASVHWLTLICVHIS